MDFSTVLLLIIGISLQGNDYQPLLARLSIMAFRSIVSFLVMIISVCTVNAGISIEIPNERQISNSIFTMEVVVFFDNYAMWVMEKVQERPQLMARDIIQRIFTRMNWNSIYNPYLNLKLGFVIKDIDRFHFDSLIKSDKVIGNTVIYNGLAFNHSTVDGRFGLFREYVRTNRYSKWPHADAYILFTSSKNIDGGTYKDERNNAIRGVSVESTICKDETDLDDGNRTIVPTAMINVANLHPYKSEEQLNETVTNLLHEIGHIIGFQHKEDNWYLSWVVPSSNILFVYFKDCECPYPKSLTKVESHHLFKTPPKPDECLMANKNVAKKSRLNLDGCSFRYYYESLTDYHCLLNVPGKEAIGKMSMSICGNGIIEADEECDCYPVLEESALYSVHESPYELKNNSCWNRCCDYKTCKFVKGGRNKVCGGGSCCNKRCQFKAEGTVCREQVNYKTGKDPCDEQDTCSGRDSHCLDKGLPDYNLIDNKHWCRNKRKTPKCHANCFGRGTCLTEGRNSSTCKCHAVLGATGPFCLLNATELYKTPDSEPGMAVWVILILVVLVMVTLVSASYLYMTFKMKIAVQCQVSQQPTESTSGVPTPS